MRLPVVRDVTFFSGGMHVERPKMINDLPGAIILKRGDEIIARLGREVVSFLAEDGTPHTIDTADFYAAVGSGCFRVSVTFKSTA